MFSLSKTPKQEIKILTSTKPGIGSTGQRKRIRRLAELPSYRFVYFVNFYYPVPENRFIIAATAEYAEEFAAVVVADILLAPVFIPRKVRRTDWQICVSLLAH
jgi:imidazoleglycerol phosphate synthase glutamine amidotransferase subunit HisH